MQYRRLSLKLAEYDSVISLDFEKFNKHEQVNKIKKTKKDHSDLIHKKSYIWKPLSTNKKKSITKSNSEEDGSSSSPSSPSFFERNIQQKPISDETSKEMICFKKNKIRRSRSMLSTNTQRESEPSLFLLSSKKRASSFETIHSLSQNEHHSNILVEDTKKITHDDKNKTSTKNVISFQKKSSSLIRRKEVQRSNPNTKHKFEIDFSTFSDSTEKEKTLNKKHQEQQSLDILNHILKKTYKKISKLECYRSSDYNLKSNIIIVNLTHAIINYYKENVMFGASAGETTEVHKSNKATAYEIKEKKHDTAKAINIEITEVPFLFLSHYLNRASCAINRIIEDMASNLKKNDEDELKKLKDFIANIKPLLIDELVKWLYDDVNYNKFITGKNEKESQLITKQKSMKITHKTSTDKTTSDKTNTEEVRTTQVLTDKKIDDIISSLPSSENLAFSQALNSTFIDVCRNYINKSHMHKSKKNKIKTEEKMDASEKVKINLDIENTFIENVNLIVDGCNNLNKYVLSREDDNKETQVISTDSMNEKITSLFKKHFPSALPNKV